MLGDSQRLRLLRLLAREKLNVSELTEILGGAQSGISRHLRLLREADLVRETRERGWSYYFVDPAQFGDGIAGLWPSLKEQLRDLEGSREDDVRLQEILRQRKEDFREQSGNVPTPGRSWAAWARTLSYLAPLRCCGRSGLRRWLSYTGSCPLGAKSDCNRQIENHTPSRKASCSEARREKHPLETGSNRKTAAGE